MVQDRTEPCWREIDHLREDCEFNDFYLENEAKIRKKLERGGDPETVMAELRSAAFFLRAEGVNRVEYEPAIEGKRPDLRVALGDDRFIVEVRALKSASSLDRVKDMIGRISGRIEQMRSDLAFHIDLLVDVEKSANADAILGLEETIYAAIVDHINLNSFVHQKYHGIDLVIPGTEDLFSIHSTVPGSPPGYPDLLCGFEAQESGPNVPRVADAIIEKLEQMSADNSNPFFILIFPLSYSLDRADIIQGIRYINDLGSRQNSEVDERRARKMKQVEHKIPLLSGVLFLSKWLPKSKEENLVWINTAANLKPLMINALEKMFTKLHNNPTERS